MGTSTLILKLEMTTCVIHNCYPNKTACSLIKQSKLFVNLQVSTIIPHTLRDVRLPKGARRVHFSRSVEVYFALGMGLDYLEMLVIITSLVVYFSYKS